MLGKEALSAGSHRVQRICFKFGMITKWQSLTPSLPRTLQSWWFQFQNKVEELWQWNSTHLPTSCSSEFLWYSSCSLRAVAMAVLCCGSHSFSLNLIWQNRKEMREGTKMGDQEANKQTFRLGSCPVNAPSQTWSRFCNGMGKSSKRALTPTCQSPLGLFQLSGIYQGVYKIHVTN